MIRTSRCGDLNAVHKGDDVVLCGWVHSRRDHGGVIFIDLRDTSGVVQVVFNPNNEPDVHDRAQALRSEWCIKVEGKVGARPEGTVNHRISTGEIEVAADGLEVFSVAETPPFQIDEFRETDELLRMRYRYLDLRREKMQHNLKMRHAIVSSIRRFFDSEGFVEVETPILTTPTPEGARDYLVPARIYPGRFYALPQSPQTFKQILMVAGIDRYYQIARCARDEDQRADRQPDFTQLDLEMSFVEREDVLDVTERCLKQVWQEVLEVELPTFERMSFAEAMDRFGSDKPDVRYGLELKNLSDVFSDTEVRVFAGVLGSGGAVKCITIPGKGASGRKELDGLVDEARSLGAGGLVWAAIEQDGIRCPLDKFFTDDERAGLIKTAEADVGDLVLIVADARVDIVHRVLGGLRPRLAQRYGFVPKKDPSDPAAWRFVWILDFPWFEYDAENDRWTFTHHPFTGITPETVEYLDSDPAKVVSQSYDITLNGWELASGSIRIHDRELQKRVFNAIGISDDEAQAKFGFLLDAFRYGVPPHGGIAPGIDRIAALAAGESNIREVIAFPKTQTAFDPMTGAPGDVTDEQMDTLHIKSTAAPPEK